MKNFTSQKITEKPPIKRHFATNFQRYFGGAIWIIRDRAGGYGIMFAEGLIQVMFNLKQITSNEKKANK